MSVSPWNRLTEILEDRQTWERLARLVPSDEQIKRFDEIARKYHAQELRILPEPESRTRIGKVLDLLAPSFGSLGWDFGEAIRVYCNLKDRLFLVMNQYQQHPTSDNKMRVREATSNFHMAVNRLDRLYHQALESQRLDEGVGKELEELRAAKVKLKADVEDLTAKLATCQENLNGLRKRLPDTSEFGDVTSN